MVTYEFRNKIEDIIYSDNLNELKTILADWIDIEWVLNEAFDNNSFKIFEYCLSKVKLGQAELDTKMIETVSSRHSEMFKSLIDNGADIHYYDDLALYNAVEDGQLNIVKYIVEKGVDIHAYDDEALSIATKNGHTEIAEYLKSLK